MSQQQAQIDAIEHLLVSYLKRCETDKLEALVFEDAKASLIGSNGPGGPTEKSAAVEYLEHLRARKP